MKFRSQLIWMIVLCVKVCSNDDSHVPEDTRRPIWNIAHMVNTRWQIDSYLDQGANSIEFDITFDQYGRPEYTYHGTPCDCFRHCLRYEYIDTYFHYMRRVTTPGDRSYRKELVLWFMDLKMSHLSYSSAVRAGRNVARKLIDLYWVRDTSETQAYVLLSIPSMNYFDFAVSFLRTIHEEDKLFYNDKIGFDFHGKENIDFMQSFLNTINVGNQTWLGDGITNCLARGTSRLRQAISKRDYSNTPFFDKVYYWTVDKMSTMRYVLKLGVDAVITNHPRSLYEVLKESEFINEVRMATLADNPWKKYSK